MQIKRCEDKHISGPLGITVVCVRTDTCMSICMVNHLTTAAHGKLASVSYSEQEMESGTDEELEPSPERSSSSDSVAGLSDAVAQVSSATVTVHTHPYQSQNRVFQSP